MRFLRMLTNAAVAGVVTAAYLTALVLLLNPQVPLASVSAGHWALAMLGFYGVLTMVAVWLLLFLREMDPQVLNSLYRDLVAPVADLMASRSKIIVVADGPLQTVPLEFLVRQYGTAEEKAFRATRQTADGSADRPFLAEYSALDYLGKSFRFNVWKDLKSASRRSWSSSNMLLIVRSDIMRSFLMSFAVCIPDGRPRRPSERY